MILLGQGVRDLITDFEGLAIGRVEYLTGCVQVLVQPPAGDRRDGSGREWVESRWFDEPRLRVTIAEPYVLPSIPTPGADKEAPRR